VGSGTQTPQRKTNAVTTLDLENWSPWGDDCPCCGDEVDWDTNYDDEMISWSHENRTDCEFSARDESDIACPNYPHQALG
jgi:hypothetical protein